MSALERWRERCEASDNQDAQWLARKVTAGEVAAAIAQAELEIALDREQNCDDKDCPICKRQDDALTWLREEVERGSDPFGPSYATDTRRICIGDWVRVEGAQFIGIIRDLPASKPGFVEVAFGRHQEPYSIPRDQILEVRRGE